MHLIKLLQKDRICMNQIIYLLQVTCNCITKKISHVTKIEIIINKVKTKSTRNIKYCLLNN